MTLDALQFVDGEAYVHFDFMDNATRAPIRRGCKFYDRVLGAVVEYENNYYGGSGALVSVSDGMAVLAVGGGEIPARLCSPVFSDRGAAYKRGAIDAVPLPEYAQAQKWKQHCGEVFEMYTKCHERARTGAFRKSRRCISGPSRCLAGGHCIEPSSLDLHPICGA